MPTALPIWPLQLPDPRGPLMMHGGLPDVRLLPAEPLARAFRRALSRHGRKLLSYGDPRGHERLRQELATMLSHAGGLAVDPENVIVTRGSQQALYLVAQALLSPADLVAVEELGNPGSGARSDSRAPRSPPYPLMTRGSTSTRSRRSSAAAGCAPSI